MRKLIKLALKASPFALSGAGAVLKYQGALHCGWFTVSLPITLPLLFVGALFYFLEYSRF
ncbi:hypothetical protein [uncultured Mediterranean phage uvMED]|nr:hypothetical protein [uncultured Mediterranean phage uvMED]BAR22603.1 hypothetical protein [uncultured Mediterranean phage uvMED]